MSILRKFNFAAVSFSMVLLPAMLTTSAAAWAQQQKSGAAWVPVVTDKNYLRHPGF